MTRRAHAPRRPRASHARGGRPRRVDPRPGRPHAAARRHGAGARRDAARAHLRQARGLQSGRLGEGPRRAVDGARRPRDRRAASRQDDHRLDLGQHRHRAGDDRRGARLSGHTGHARQRQPRAQAHHQRLRRRGRSSAAAWRDRTAPSCCAASCSPRTPERYFKPDQYFNPMNPQAHYESTGPEIWEATERPRHALRRRHRHRRHRSWAPAAT